MKLSTTSRKRLERLVALLDNPPPGMGLCLDEWIRPGNGERHLLECCPITRGALHPWFQRLGLRLRVRLTPHDQPTHPRLVLVDSPEHYIHLLREGRVSNSDIIFAREQDEQHGFGAAAALLDISWSESVKLFGMQVYGLDATEQIIAQALRRHLTCATA